MMFEKIKHFLKKFRLTYEVSHDEWYSLKRREEVDQLVQASYGRPQLVFKHSTRCMISSRAWSKMEKLTGQLKQERHAVDIHLVDVIRHRGVSDYLSEISDISHESPQAILWEQGSVQLNFSHTDIQANTLFDWLKTNLPLEGANA